MPGALHADLLAHLLTPAPEVHWVFELDLADGTTVRLSLDGVASKSLGTYRPWLTSIETLRRRLTDWRGGLEAPTCGVTIDDTGGQFTLAYGRRLRGRPARLKLLGPYSLPVATHFTWFTGVVDKCPKSGSLISMALRYSDDRMAASIPKPTIQGNVFTSLPAETDLRGKAITYLVGDHDSTGLNALGMVLCPYVGSPGANRYQHLVCDGWWQSVTRVFADGVELAPTTDYTVLQSITGDSRRVTLLEFVADQSSKEVLADLHDADSAVGPAAVLQQLAADLAYGDGHGQHLAPSTAPLHAASVAALDVVLAGLGLGRSYAVPTDRRTLTAIAQEFCMSYAASAYWRYDGTLGLLQPELRYQNDTALLGPGAPDSGLALRQVITPDIEISEPGYDCDSESTITRVQGDSGLRASDGSWLNTRSVVLSIDEVLERSRKVELPWLPASAESVGNLEYLQATAESAVAGFTAVGAATVWQAVSQGPPPAAPSLSVYARSDSAATIGAGAATFDLTLSNVPDMVAATNLTLWLVARAENSDGADEDELYGGVVIGGVPYLGTTVVGLGRYPVYIPIALFPADPSTSLAWTQSGLNGASARVIWVPQVGAGPVNSTKRVRILQAYGLLTYTAAANVSPSSLAILSRMANRYRQAPEVMTARVPLRFLDYDLGDHVPLEDPREGWGGEPWARGRGMIVGMTVGPGMGGGVELELEDVSQQLTTFWLQGRALAGVSRASAAGDGMALLVPGNTVTVTRAAPKCLDSPAGIGVQSIGPIVQILNNCWPSDRWGTLIEGARTNGLFRSCFKTLSGGSGSVPTGWTATSGSVASDDTVGEQLFVDATVSPNVLLLTRSALADARATGTATGTYLANTKVVVSIARRSSSATAGDGGAWRLTRAVDGWCWNNTTPGWQAGAVDNSLDPSTVWAPFESAPFSVGAANTTLTLQLVHLSTATAASEVRFGYGQIEGGEWASSFIPTEAAAATRAADEISVDNDKNDGSTLAHVMPNARGWFRWHVRMRWSSANVTAGTIFTLFNLTYDANNSWTLAYVVGTGWRLRARASGSNVDVVVNVAVTAGLEYDVSFRWTSSLGEWDKPLTLTLVVRRVSTGAVLGSAEATYTAPTFVAAASFQLGHAAGGDQLNGYVIEARESPLPPSDAQMAAAVFDLAEVGA